MSEALRTESHQRSGISKELITGSDRIQAKLKESGPVKQHRSTPDVRHLQIGVKISVTNGNNGQDGGKRVLSIDAIQPERNQNIYQNRTALANEPAKNGNTTDNDVVYAVSPRLTPEAEDIEWGVLPQKRSQDRSKQPLARTRSNEHDRVKHNPRTVQQNVEKDCHSEAQNLSVPAAPRSKSRNETKAQSQSNRLSDQELFPQDLTSDKSSINSSRSSITDAIVTQPMSFDPINSKAKAAADTDNKCAKCHRGQSSSEHRRLPGSWICGGKWYCSCSSVVDLLSCMCIVKGLFYHCCDEPHDVDPDPHPCDCSCGRQCVSRWASMAAMSLCLPCLLCYLPLKAGQKAIEACYNFPCCRSASCKCDKK